MTAAQHEADLKRAARAEYSRSVRSTKEAEKKIRAKRKTRMKKAAVKCEVTRAASRAAVSEKCAERRSHIRGETHAELAKQKATRTEKRTKWKWRTGGVELKKGQLRYSRPESDSLALQNVPDDLAGLFMKTRSDWSYGLQPDGRAEVFMEWIETDPEELMQWRISQVPTDEAFKRAEAAAYEAALEEAVPF